MPRWAKITGVATVVIVGGLAVAVAVAWSKLPEIVADQASKATGRTVRIAGLHLSLGRWVGVEMHDASLANLPGGTRPEMATLDRLTGEVALWPLLHGRVLARSVRVEGADILLEKVGGQPNWRNGPKQPAPADGGRPGFPTILDAVVNGAVTFRTTSGSPLVTRLQAVKLEAANPAAPARITGPGSYHGAPVMLDLRLGSYDQLHDAAQPFPTDITLTSGDTVLHFDGTMTDPLNVDGARGTLSMVAPTPGAVEKIAGISPSPAPPMRLEGAMVHDKDLWSLEQAKGALGQAAVEDGHLVLHEGRAETKAPDRIDVALRFGAVNLDHLVAAFGGGGNSDGKGSGGERSSFVPQVEPDPLLSAKLAADQLTYRKIEFTQPKLAVTLAPRVLKLDGASFGALSGQVSLDGQVQTGEDGKTGVLAAQLTATGLEVSQLRSAVGVDKLPLSGRVDLHAVANGAGPTAEAALEEGRASVVATMSGGSVSEQLIELASTDVTGLVRSSKATVPLSCLLAVMEVHGGVGTVGPVRLRSSQGTIVARGKVDLRRESFDVVVASEARTTGALALNVPVRAYGSFDDPSIEVAAESAGRAALAGGSLANLAAALRPQAQRSRCSR